MSNLSKTTKTSGNKIPTCVTLRDGSIAKVNDFVYLDSISQGDFYQIARIMQFLPSTKRDIRAEVAHFYRRCNTGIDWSSKDDPQLLYITLSTENVHACHMVAKCTVTHISLIQDLEEYRRLENHFFFTQFFEKFQGHIFEVVPTSQINNLPQNVIPKLQSLFSFVFGEKSEIRKLKDSRKDCVICHNWCGNASSTSVSCIICEETYHKQCANPPITTNFTKGFVFQCAQCLSKAKVDFDDPTQTYIHLRPGGKNHPASNTNTHPNKRSTSYESEAPSKLCYTPIELTCTQNHPIRYLGKNISIEQALDPFSSLHVKIIVAVGKDHQIDVPNYMGPLLNNAKKAIPAIPAIPPEINTGNNIKCLTSLQYGMPLPAAKLIVDKDGKEGSTTLKEDLMDNEEDYWHCSVSSNTLFRPQNKKEEHLAEKIFRHARREDLAIPFYSLQLGERAYSEMMKQNLDEAGVILTLKSLRASDFNYYDHLADDRKFEAALLKHGLDFDLLAGEFPPMTPRGAVQRFYTWKAEIVRQKERSGPNFASRDNRLMAMVYPDEQAYQLESSNEGNPTRRRRQTAQVIKSCAHCRSRDEPKWQSVPTFVTQQPSLLSIYCVPCANYLFRYAVPRPLIDSTAPGKRNFPRNFSKNGLEDHNDRKNHESSRKEKSILNKKPGPRLDSASRSSTAKPSASYRSSLASSPINNCMSEPVSTTSSIFSEPGVGIKRQCDSQLDPIMTTRIKTDSLPNQFSNNVFSCKVCCGTAASALIACNACGLQVHSGCYPGLESDASWCCDWCKNQSSTVASQNTTCSACLKVHSDLICLKRTSGNRWVHLSCFTFITPLWLNHDHRISGLPGITEKSWSNPCNLCLLDIGLTVKCSCCSKTVHISCAQASNFWLGFKTLPECETLNPVIICQDHIHTKDKFHTELFDVGVDGNTSHLAVFFKSRIKLLETSTPAFPASSTALGPLARIMNNPLFGKSFYNRKPRVHPPCYECQSTFSSFWWNIFPDSKPSAEEGLASNLEISFHRPGHQYRICHLCYWKMQDKTGANVSPLVSSESTL